MNTDERYKKITETLIKNDKENLLNVMYEVLIKEHPEIMEETPCSSSNHQPKKE